MKMMHIGHAIDPQLKPSDPCKDSLDLWSKVFCLKTVHTGVKKQVSNNSSIEFYECHRRGQRLSQHCFG